MWFSARCYRGDRAIDEINLARCHRSAPVMVREDALIAASVMIAAVAGMSSHKRKQ
jgi:hypothetical protein